MKQLMLLIITATFSISSFAGDLMPKSVEKKQMDKVQEVIEQQKQLETKTEEVIDFSAIDTNSDELISQDEATKVLALSKAFKTLDSNGDGILDRSEFLSFEKQS